MGKINILILGGDSFIGNNFILQNKELYNFVIISRKETGVTGEVILDDFFSIADSYFNNIQVVINFAAIVHQQKAVEPQTYFKINAELPVHIAVKAKKAGCKHFIQMSTIAVYGYTNHIDHNTIEMPINDYGKSKLLADKQLMTMQDNNFKIAIVRPPMIYGLGNAPGNMMRLIKLVDKGFPLPFKNARNKRDFLNIHNLYHFLCLLIEKQYNGIFLISDNQAISTNQLVEKINHLLKRKNRQFYFPVFFVKLFLKSLYHKLYASCIINISETLNNTNYFPKMRIEEGLKEMIDWYKKNKL